MADFNRLTRDTLRGANQYFGMMTRSPIVRRMMGRSWWQRSFGNSSLLGRVVGAPITIPLGLSALALSLGQTSVNSIISLFDIRPALKDEVRDTINARIDEIAAIAIVSTFVIAATVVITRARR